MSWLGQFTAWHQAVRDAGLPEPEAMVLATADADGLPSARSVLLRGVDERGFVFFTNYESRKGTELGANPNAALVFPWWAVHRQITVAGARGTGERRGVRRLLGDPGTGLTHRRAR